MGPENTELAKCWNNLATLYQGEGRYQESERMQLRSLAVKEKLLSSDHPDLILGWNNLGDLYRTTGRFMPRPSRCCGGCWPRAKSSRASSLPTTSPPSREISRCC